MSLGAAQLLGAVCSEWLGESWHCPTGHFFHCPEDRPSTNSLANYMEIDRLLTWIDGEFVVCTDDRWGSAPSGGGKAAIIVPGVVLLFQKL